VGFKKVQGLVTAIAHGPELTTYFRVRTHAEKFGVTSQWFLSSEVTWLGDSLYGIT